MEPGMCASCDRVAPSVTPCITYSVGAMFLRSVWYGFEIFFTIFVISKGLRNKNSVFISSSWTKIRYLYRHCEQKFGVYIVIVKKFGIYIVILNKNSAFISSLWRKSVFISSLWKMGILSVWTKIRYLYRHCEHAWCLREATVDLQHLLTHRVIMLNKPHAELLISSTACKICDALNSSSNCVIL
jgi:hypothetical protein